jgi:hypothetical protein
MTKTTFVAASLLGCLFTPGCGAGSIDESDDAEDRAPLGESSDALTSPMTNGSSSIDYAAYQYYANPDIAVSQWAEASFNGTSCNGVMIGPNIYFTAAHCGGPPGAPILFRTYRSGGPSASDTEAFPCTELLQTFNDTDGAVFFCQPNAAGENPGDKYGYVDFDTSTPTVGQQVYSISANAIVNGSVPWDARMYTTGQVTSVTDNGWFVPDISPNTGMSMNLWGEPGMSGSPHFNAANHKMLIAPLSTAPGGGGWNRNAASMQSLLYWGYVNPNYDPAQQGPTVNTAFVSSLGLTPGNYYGWVDGEPDGEFDIQRDVERLRGEARRGWYWLGFESLRRNVLWDPVAPYTSLDTVNRWARITKTTGGYADALSHKKLNLKAGAYRVTLMTYTVSASFSNTLWVSLKNGASYVGGEYVPNTVGSGWQMHSLNVTAPVDNLELILGAYGPADILVMALSVAKQGEVMDFDTFDKRYNWRNDITGTRAQVVPDGAVTGTPNWAVRVSTPPTTGYPVRNRQLAFVAGQPYRICFDAKRSNVSGSAQGELRVMSAGVLAVSATFTPSSVWSHFCSTTFTPASDDNNMQARLVSGDSPFLVDNIAITEM